MGEFNLGRRGILKAASALDHAALVREAAQSGADLLARAKAG